MGKKTARKRVEAQEFVLKNESGGIIAVLEATGLGTPILHMFHAKGAGVSIGLAPDGSAFVEVKHSDGSMALAVTTDRHGGLNIGVPASDATTAVRFRSDKDGSSFLEINRELAVRGKEHVVMD